MEFERNGKKYKLVEDEKGGCHECAFRNKDCNNTPLCLDGYFVEITNENVK